MNPPLEAPGYCTHVRHTGCLLCRRGGAPVLFSQSPEPQGLYDPALEADSCGVAMVADILGRRSHSIVSDGLLALANLEHRGAAGAEPNSGDGAGILLQLPTALLTEVAG